VNVILQCPECGWTADLYDFDVVGADDGCLFCLECSHHGPMREVDDPQPDLILTGE
jgi:hypothetical protein